MNLPPFLTSSVDPSKLALSIRGFLVLLVPAVMLVTGISEDYINTLLDMVQEIVFWGATAWGAFAMTYGLIRKGLVYLKLWGR